MHLEIQGPAVVQSWPYAQYGCVVGNAKRVTGAEGAIMSDRVSDDEVLKTPRPPPRGLARTGSDYL